jgi:hypothetical protein
LNNYSYIRKQDEVSRDETKAELDQVMLRRKILGNK